MNDEKEKFDVFLCHNSADKNEVEEIGRRLKNEGVRPWLDKWEIVPGQLWKTVLEEQIESIASAAVFFGENGLGPWQDFEQKAFLSQFVRRKCPVIPVILAKCKETPAMPPFLSEIHRVDFRKSDLDPLQELIKGIRQGRNPSAGPSPNPATVRNRRIFIRIENTGDGYQARVEGNRASNAPFEVRLSPEDKIKNRDRPFTTVGQLSELLAWNDYSDASKLPDKEKQLFIGDHLFTQIFREQTPRQIADESDAGVDVRVVTDDAHIARLPWGLFAHAKGGWFLADSGWTVSLASNASNASSIPECRLPRNPELLIVAPETAGMEKAMAARHVEDLANFLCLYNPYYERGKSLKVAQTWEEFEDALRYFKPHLVYYYGRHALQKGKSWLAFKKTEGNEPVGKKLEEFADAIRQAPMSPELVYLNFYRGGRGVLHSVERLCEIAPATICNHCVSDPAMARAQALAIWPMVLLDGLSPPRALAGLPSRLSEMTGVHRWTAPLLFRSYDAWKYDPGEKHDPLKDEPYWHLKLDRVSQFGTVSYQTREMMKNHSPRILAYVWYGKEGQGVGLFHERLKTELETDLRDLAHFEEIRPEWPPVLEMSDRKQCFDAFDFMIAEAFRVHCFEDVPQAIRRSTKGESGRHILVYIRHRPVHSNKRINPLSLKWYLEWMDERFAPVLGNRYHALATVSFVVKNPAKFREAAVEKVKLNHLNMSYAVFKLLDQMERLAIEDLVDFCKLHKIPIDPERRDRLLAEIMKQTGGHYRQTVDALREMVRRAMSAPAQTSGEDLPEDMDFDY